MLSLVENDKISISKSMKQRYVSKKKFHIAIAATPFPTFLFYIEDENAWFFGPEFVNYDRHRIYNNGVYHMEVMMSCYLVLVTHTNISSK